MAVALAEAAPVDTTIVVVAAAGSVAMAGAVGGEPEAGTASSRARTSMVQPSPNLDFRCCALPRH